MAWRSGIVAAAYGVGGDSRRGNDTARHQAIWQAASRHVTAAAHSAVARAATLRQRANVWQNIAYNCAVTTTTMAPRHHIT